MVEIWLLTHDNTPIESCPEAGREPCLEAIVDLPEVVDASVGPRGSLETLSQSEIDVLLNTGQGGIHPLFRKCALAVLNSGSDSDNAKELFERYRDFDVKVVRHPWGIRLRDPQRAGQRLRRRPDDPRHQGAPVRGAARRGLHRARDRTRAAASTSTDSTDITNAVFHVLRNARVLDRKIKPNLVVCWGGHSISEVEYQYTKKVGYELGLRGLDVCTGCGPGAMKGPMKGATIGHAKQRITHGPLHRPHRARHHRRRAAQRHRQPAGDHAGHRKAPGGLRAPRAWRRGVPGRRGHGRGNPLPAGHPAGSRATRSSSLPVVFTGPEQSAGYFEQIREFIDGAAGRGCAAAAAVHRRRSGCRGAPDGHAKSAQVRTRRRASNDSYSFNWLLHVPEDFQHPFEATHETHARGWSCIATSRAHLLVANLRRAFSGIVAGNVKEQGIAAIEAHGPFELQRRSGAHAPARRAAARPSWPQGRMKLPGSVYKPCYRIVT